MSGKEDKTKYALHLNGSGANMASAKQAISLLNRSLPQRLGINSIGVGSPQYMDQSAQKGLHVPFSVKSSVSQHQVEVQVARLFGGQAIYVEVRG